IGVPLVLSGHAIGAAVRGSQGNGHHGHRPGWTGRLAHPQKARPGLAHVQRCGNQPHRRLQRPAVPCPPAKAVRRDDTQSKPGRLHQSHLL
nr:hypothetical protein [Tanacetum cinerariifolium]